MPDDSSNPLAPFFSAEPMSGPQLSHVRNQLSLLLGEKVQQTHFAELFGTSQPQMSRWESAAEVPHRVATLARLLIIVARMHARPESHRPNQPTLFCLRELMRTVQAGAPDYGTWGEAEARQQHLLAIEADASALPLIEWVSQWDADHAEAAPGDTQPAE